MSSVTRSLEILEALVDAQQAPTHAELARALKIPKSTLSQILEQLTEANYIGQSGRRYFADIRLLSLGQRITHSSHARGAIKSRMDHLATRTGETVLLGTLVSNHLMQLEQSPSPQPIRYVTEVGAPRPLHCTAGGKVLLAFSNRSAGSLGPLPKLTDKTVTDPAKVDKMLETVRRQGYSLNKGESVDDVASIAAPIMSDTGDVLAALTVTGPAHRMTDMRERTLPLLLETIRDIGTGRLA